MPSGRCAGWRRGNYLFHACGECVGFFEGDIAFSLDGNYVGEITEGDWIGRRSNLSYGRRIGRVADVGLGVSRYANRAGQARGGWDNPDF